MSILRREHGFTLIEGLVAMACAVIVFGATLTVLEVYMRQSNGVTQRFDAQNQARIAVDRIVRQLRNVASPLTSQPVWIQCGRDPARQVLHPGRHQLRQLEQGGADQPDADLDDSYRPERSVEL
jgi:type II secretory pathway pseudopilin PulG